MGNFKVSPWLESEKTKKACTSISSLTFTYDEADMVSDGFFTDGFGSDWFRVGLDYPNQYREIKMIQAIDFQTVIGNAGGYIGLFLGKIILIVVKSMIFFEKSTLIQL